MVLPYLTARKGRKEFVMTIRSYGILAVAVLAGCAVALACKAATAADTVPVKQVVVAKSVTPVVKVRTFARPVVVGGVVAGVERRAAPQYTIVEQPSNPFVWNGIFRDRVVFPKRKQLSVEIQ
jgi:hypothetical protein